MNHSRRGNDSIDDATQRPASGAARRWVPLTAGLIMLVTVFPEIRNSNGFGRIQTSILVAGTTILLLSRVVATFALRLDILLLSTATGFGHTRRRRPIPTLTHLTIIVLVLGIIGNIVLRHATPKDQYGLLAGNGVTLEAVYSTTSSQGSHRVWYLYTLMRQLARGGTLIINDPGFVADNFLWSDGVLALARMDTLQTAYDPTDIPISASDSNHEVFSGVHQRRWEGPLSEYHLVVADGGPPVDLVIYYEDAQSFYLVDSRLSNVER